MTEPQQDVLNYSSDDEKDVQKKKAPGRQGRVKAKKQITTTHAATFNDFHLKEELIRATGEAGFENPSEV